MGEALEYNETRFAYCSVFGSDERGYSLITPVIKGTFDITRDGDIHVAEEAENALMAPQHRGEPGESSYLLDADTAPVKLSTDIALIGHARSTQAGQTSIDCGIKVGNSASVARVYGDRYWVRQGGRVVTTSPKEIEAVELSYENAYGGFDGSTQDSGSLFVHQSNPVGKGYLKEESIRDEPVPLPNVEHREQRLRHPGQDLPPIGFGFICPEWSPRKELAGTYDAAWQKTRSPLLPLDFDRRFYNAASRGLVASGYLQGDEPVTIVNASVKPRLEFRLPAIPPPTCELRLHGLRDKQPVETHLDTVIVNTDKMTLSLIWRGVRQLVRGAQDVREVYIETSHPAMKKPKGEY